MSDLKHLDLEAEVCHLQNHIADLLYVKGDTLTVKQAEALHQARRWLDDVANPLTLSPEDAQRVANYIEQDMADLDAQTANDRLNDADRREILEYLSLGDELDKLNQRKE